MVYDTIEVSTSGGKVYVGAYIIGQFAVHQKVDGEQYVITHVNSGLRLGEKGVFEFYDRNLADKAAELLDKMLDLSDVYLGEDGKADCDDKEVKRLLKDIISRSLKVVWEEIGAGEIPF